MGAMEELERRVVQRLLAFCHENQLIGPYVFDEDRVQVVAEGDCETFTVHNALRYLLAVTEESGLADQFYETISKRGPVSALSGAQ